LNKQHTKKENQSEEEVLTQSKDNPVLLRASLGSPIVSVFKLKAIVSNV